MGKLRSDLNKDIATKLEVRRHVRRAWGVWREENFYGAGSNTLSALGLSAFAEEAVRRRLYRLHTIARSIAELSFTAGLEDGGSNARFNLWASWLS